MDEMCQRSDYPPYDEPVPPVTVPHVRTAIPFRELEPAEVEQFREWAREHFDPTVEPSQLWHPVVREQWAKEKASWLEAEHEEGRHDEERADADGCPHCLADAERWWTRYLVQE